MNTLASYSRLQFLRARLMARIDHVVFTTIVRCLFALRARNRHRHQRKEMTRAMRLSSTMNSPVVAKGSQHGLIGFMMAILPLTLRRRQGYLKIISEVLYRHRNRLARRTGLHSVSHRIGRIIMRFGRAIIRWHPGGIYRLKSRSPWMLSFNRCVRGKLGAAAI